MLVAHVISAGTQFISENEKAGNDERKEESSGGNENRGSNPGGTGGNVDDAVWQPCRAAADGRRLYRSDRPGRHDFGENSVRGKTGAAEEGYRDAGSGHMRKYEGDRAGANRAGRRSGCGGVD